MQNSCLQSLNLIAQTLFDKKGFNILVLDMHEVSTLTDYFVLAEGNVDQHVVALAHAVMDAMKSEGHRTIHVEGMESGDWVVLDFIDIVVHIFKPGVREKYGLEEVWKAASVIDVTITVAS